MGRAEIGCMARSPHREGHNWMDQRTVNTHLRKSFAEDSESNGPVNEVHENNPFEFNKKRMAIGLR
jgi:hypothetical protein